MLTLLDHIDSLKRCLALQVNLIFPGHGNIIEHPGPLIEKDSIASRENHKKSWP